MKIVVFYFLRFAENMQTIYNLGVFKTHSPLFTELSHLYPFARFFSVS